MMVYRQFHLPCWSLIRTNSVFLIFFCQLISSSSKFDNRALIIIKSIDNYLCQNYVFTCFFRQRYYPSLDQQQFDKCQFLLILHLCLHYDTNSIRVCNQSILNRTKTYLTNETSTYCFTSSVYKTLYAQHLYSSAVPRTTINSDIFMLFILFISFAVRMRVCC
jgi:hypothetical protein